MAESLVIGFEGLEGRLFGGNGLGDIPAIVEGLRSVPGVQAAAFGHWEERRGWGALEAWAGGRPIGDGGAAGGLVLLGYSWGADAARRLSLRAWKRLRILARLVVYVDGIEKRRFLFPGFEDFSPRKGRYARFWHWNSPLDVLRTLPGFAASRSLDDPPAARRALNVFERSDRIIHGQPVRGMENLDLTAEIRSAADRRYPRQDHLEISRLSRPVVERAVREALGAPPPPPAPPAPSQSPGSA